MQRSNNDTLSIIMQLEGFVDLNHSTVALHACLFKININGRFPYIEVHQNHSTSSGTCAVDI